MTTLNERGREGIIRKLRNMNRIKIMIFSVFGSILFVILCMFAYDRIGSKTYSSFKKLTSYERLDSNTVNYLPYDGKLLKYSRDGASAIDEKGNVIWNGSYEMKEPMVDICGKYVAIADYRAKEIYVYNGKDTGTVITVDYPISMIRVAKQGVVAVLLEDGESNVTRIYNPYASSDSLLVEIPTNISTDGYPVDIAISPDAKSLVTSYISVKDGMAESNVCFYNFSDVGQDNSRIVGGCSFKESLVSKLDFIEDDKVCILLDDGFSIYSNMKQPYEVCTVNHDKEIKSVIAEKGYVGLVFEAFDEESTYELILYNAMGKEVLKRGFDYEYDKIRMVGKEIIFYSDSKAEILRIDGSEKLKTTFSSKIEYFIGSQKSDKYFLIDANQVSVVKPAKE